MPKTKELIPQQTKDIEIKGARVHNLKNVNVSIPRNNFIVITGLSGSGKSSLAFDTLYAEGQRRYVESLSSYARQFLGKIDKPDVDVINGISPAVAIEQKVNTRNPRSTVGTSTEVYDYLKLLFARAGKTISPVSGKEVKRDTPDSIFANLHDFDDGTKAMLMAPFEVKSLEKDLKKLSEQGFSRIMINGEILRISDIEINAELKKLKSLDIVVDRISIQKQDDDNKSRILDSIQTAFYEGNGKCKIAIQEDSGYKFLNFSNLFELDGIRFQEPNEHFFTFNNPLGACKRCEGFGSIIGIDEDLVIPDKNLSVYDQAIVCWKGEKMSEWNKQLVNNAHHFDFPIHKPIYELSEKQYQLLWEGNSYFDGLNAFFKHIEEQAYKIQYRVMLSRYRGKTKCTECGGTRLRKDANYVKVAKKSITELSSLSLQKLQDIFQNIDSKLDDNQKAIAKRLLVEITNRLQYLNDVGLGYLTLNRLSNSLSGGESQRINLATSLGSSLVGSMYILDEPSIGLHPRDTERLVKVLRNLQKLGNTVIVVEHEEEVMREADQIIDIGPEAGRFGGEIVFQGSQKELIEHGESLTAKYLTSEMTIPIPAKRRKWKNFIEVTGARENNLKNIDVKFPLNIMTVVTGVSGSGKTSLVSRILFPAIKKMFSGYQEATGSHNKLSGNLNAIQTVEFVNQNPIGKSSRSNPVTYVKAYDDIRSLFASQRVSKLRGYKPSTFSFNVEGGRCETCKGDGNIIVEMQFMPDIELLCEECNGKRFKDEVLDVQYKEKSIADILDMSIDEALEFFSETSAVKVKRTSAEKKLLDKLGPLQEVGLGYLKMGQASSTLSGGEAQRIKLASFLIKGNSSTKTLFIFDEPTTGLHFHDINKLLYAFNALIEIGHSILIIEHNQEVIKCADWVIDLGPEGGDDGGYLVFEGTPEDLINEKKSYTGKYLKEKLN